MNALQEKLAPIIERLFLRLVEKWRLPCLVIILILTLAALFFSLRVRIDSSNSSMVSLDRQLQANYDLFRKTFGADEMLLLAVSRPDLLQPRGLQSVDRLSDEIASLRGVTRVLSLTNAVQLVPGELGSEAVPLVAKPYREQDLPEVARALERNPEQSRLLLSRDRQTGAVLIDLAGDPVLQGEALAAIEALLAARFSDENLHLTGIPLLKLTVSRLIQRDQRVIIPFSVLILGLLLLVMFRRLSGVLLPLAAMAIALCWTIGLYSLSGYPLNTITALLPPVIMVLSIATTVHLYSGWLQLAGEPGDPKILLAREMQRLFLPCLFTAITTALGLISLLVSAVPAVQLFGLFSALGVMLSFLVNILVVPSVLSFLPIPESGRRLYETGALSRLLRTAAELTVSSPRLVLISSLLLACAALTGVARIENNTDLVRFLKPEARLHRDTRFIDEALGGVNRIEFMLTRKDGRALTSLDDLTRLDTLQESIDLLPKVAGSYSILSVLKQLNRAERQSPGAAASGSGGADRPAEAGREKTPAPGLTLPGDEDDLPALFDLLEVAPDQAFLRKMISADFGKLRLSVRTRAIGTSETAQLVARIEEMAAARLGAKYQLTPTGEYYQVVMDSNRLVANVVSSFTLSLAMVFGAIFILFRSLKLLALSLIPNLIPLAWTAGLMGLLGIDLSTGTAMIAAVAIGLTVDSTIHYLARFQREERGDCREAVRRTTMATGRALTISALVLFFGFAVGGLSSFLPTIYFSVLTGITMLGAVLCDLLVLPASLVLYETSIRRAA